MPVIGFLGGASLDNQRNRSYLAAGLAETGYVEGRNVAFEYRWADYHLDRLPALAAELVQREVAVIIASNTASLVAAKAAAKSIPIVFETGTDPVASGFVTSLSRPGGKSSWRPPVTCSLY